MCSSKSVIIDDFNMPRITWNWQEGFLAPNIETAPTVDRDALAYLLEYLHDQVSLVKNDRNRQLDLVFVRNICK